MKIIKARGLIKNQFHLPVFLLIILYFLAMFDENEMYLDNE